jgi:DNA-binding PadR family transcriptional regulator
MFLPRVLKNRDIVVLGLLMNQPRYGYEIKVLLDNALTHLINVDGGSLYYSLKQLQQRGLIQEVAVEKIGRRPERSIYELTPLGRQVFQQEIDKRIFPASGSFDPLDLALYFINVLDLRSLTRQLAMRKAMLSEAYEFFCELLGPESAQLDQVHELLLRHRQMMLNMEIDFLETLLHDLTGGKRNHLTVTELRTIAESWNSYKQTLVNGLWADKDLRLTNIA